MDVPPAREGVDDHHLDTAEEVLEKLSPRNDLWAPDPRAWIYRGHAHAYWELRASAARDLDAFAKFGIPRIVQKNPGVARPAWSERAELLERMLTRFRGGLDDTGMEIPTSLPAVNLDERGGRTTSAEPLRSAFPLMALAQHHGLPTLLLDWTRRAWNAAYFACAEAADVDGPSSGGRLAIWALRWEVLASGEAQIYRAPARTNPNLHAQSGLFTVHASVENLSLDQHLLTLKSNSAERGLRRLTLPRSEAPKLLRLLSYEGIDGATLFPGADGVVQSMREQAIWDRAR